MRSRKLVSLIVLLFSLSSAFAQIAPAEAAQPATERLRELKAIEKASFREGVSEPQRHKEIVSAYEQLFPYNHAGIELMSPEDVQASFTAAFVASTYGLNPRSIMEMDDYLGALETSHSATRADYTMAHGVYLAARMFDKAKQLEAKHSEIDLEQAPEIDGKPAIDKPKPSKLVLGDDGHSLRYVPVDVRGKLLVVITHPLCHFSANAIREITARKDLSDAFQDALWLVPPGGPTLYFAKAQQWNNTYPSARMAFMYHREDWPMIDGWATPTFYFMSHGKVVQKVEGWPHSGAAEAFLKAYAEWKSAP